MDDRHQANLDDAATPPEAISIGARLRSAREAAGLSITEIASRTRVPIRHLEAIEAGEYSALPGSTYTIGFTRSYAKALDLDEAAIVDGIREELVQGGYRSATAKTPDYEPADPARVPSRSLAWGAAALALLLIAAYFVWRSYALSPVAENGDAKPVAEAPIKDQSGQSKAVAAIDPAGEVVIAARETVWIRIYDADEARLFEGEMQPGQRFVVPANANNPMIVTGRPQVLDVTIGGKPVPALGSGDRAIADVGVSAPALLARKPTAPANAATPNAATPAETPARQ